MSITKVILGLLVSLFCSNVVAKEMPAKEFYRLEECHRILDVVGKAYWPDLKGFRGPWVYVTEQGQFVVNYPKPLKGFEKVQLKGLKSSVFKPKSIQWSEKKQVTLDGVDHNDEPVFLFNSISNDPKDLDYKNPIAYTASIEIVGKTVPFADTEDWMSLFLHEVFHQYQFSNPGVFNQYASLKNRGLYISSEDLAEIFAKNDWFKAGVLEENRILLGARAETDHKKKNALLQEFLKKRTERRLRYKKETGKSIEESEALWEMLEGGARYFEFGTFRLLKTLEPNANLAKTDDKYGSNKRYQKDISTDLLEDLDKDKKRKRYFYTTGFNMYMLLEQLKPGFQKDLFVHMPFYAEQVLVSNEKSNPSKESAHE